MLTVSYETDADYKSRDSQVKWGWRWEMLGLMKQYFPKGIPKGQKFVTLAGRYMMGNKIDPNSEIGMGLSLGLFTPDQVVCIDGSADVVKSNKGAERLGITNIQGDFAKVIEEGNLGKIAFVSADFMRSLLLIGHWVGRIMRACNKKGQPDKTLLFVNGLCKNGFMAKKLVESPFYYFKKHHLANALSNRKNNILPYIWTETPYFKSDADHVTSRIPLKSCLLIKSPNKDYGKKKRLTWGQKAWVTRINRNLGEPELTPAQKAWVTRRKNAK